MKRSRTSRGVMAVTLLLCAGSALAEALEAQALPLPSAGTSHLPLRPIPPGGYVIAPFMEGWYDNGDGTYTISFGYLNRNDDVIEIPIGENNFIEPAQFNGMQPTVFNTGHPRGIFTVTLPADASEMDVWWTIGYPDGQEARVPGRISSGAYQLDYFPRPHGTVAPIVSFEESDETGQWPSGIVWDGMQQVRVGELLTLSVNVQDISVRDPNDLRAPEEPPSIMVTWSKHQGPPGEIEWVRHPSTPEPEPPEDGDGRAGGAGGGGGGGGFGRGGGPPPPERVEVEGPGGTALVQARFPAPGEYLLRVQADQFGSARDSSGSDQCCWTNGYVRVVATP